MLYTDSFSHLTLLAGSSRMVPNRTRCPDPDPDLILTLAILGQDRDDDADGDDGESGEDDDSETSTSWRGEKYEKCQGFFLGNYKFAKSLFLLLFCRWPYLKWPSNLLAAILVGRAFYCTWLRWSLIVQLQWRNLSQNTFFEELAPDASWIMKLFAMQKREKKAFLGGRKHCFHQ